MSWLLSGVFVFIALRHSWVSQVFSLHRVWAEMCLYTIKRWCQFSKNFLILSSFCHLWHISLLKTKKRSKCCTYNRFPGPKSYRKTLEKQVYYMWRFGYYLTGFNWVRVWSSENNSSDVSFPDWFFSLNQSERSRFSGNFWKPSKKGFRVVDLLQSMIIFNEGVVVVFNLFFAFSGQKNCRSWQDAWNQGRRKFSFYFGLIKETESKRRRWNMTCLLRHCEEVSSTYYSYAKRNIA